MTNAEKLTIIRDLISEIEDLLEEENEDEKRKVLIMRLESYRSKYYQFLALQQIGG